MFCWIFGAFAQSADLAITNANVITIDAAQPRAQAFLVRDGHFAAVGSNDQIRKLASADAQFVDLTGKTVVPGMIDSHLHPRPEYPQDSPYETVALGPEAVADMKELIAALRKKARATPKGTTIVGRGYQDTKLGRHPNRHDLDQASTEHPILITHSSGHVSAANSLVLEMGGITAATKDPSGGAFDRDPDGTPNGVLRESARGLLNGKVPPAPAPGFEEQVQALLHTYDRYAAKGITSVAVAGGSPDNFKLFQAAKAAGNPVRTYFMYQEGSLPQVKAAGLMAGLGDERLKIGAIKVFHGNSLSGRTCWVSEEYSDQPGYFGIPPARSQADLDKLIAEIHNAGFQAAVHSNGDREIDMVLTAIERAQAANPRPDARHRIEHASIMTQSLLDRAKKAGVVLVFHSYMWEHGDKLASFGAKRLAMMHPHRTALDMGIALAGHSDDPVSAADPLLRIHDMVNRRGSNGKLYGENQRVTPEEALRVFTLGGAFAMFEEKSRGSIAAGKLADFVVLDQDLTKAAPDTIKDIPVAATYISGTKVFPK